MQKTELTFIIQCFNPLSKKWTDVCYNRCGIRRHKYYKAKEQAEKILTVFDKYEGTYRIIKKYLHVQETNTKQLRLYPEE